MATKEDIAQSLATHIRQCGASLDIQQYVQSKIDNLVYSKTQEPLSGQDKLDIIENINIELSAPRTGKLRFLGESDDSRDFIELIKAIQDKYKKQRRK